MGYPVRDIHGSVRWVRRKGCKTRERDTTEGCSRGTVDAWTGYVRPRPSRGSIDAMGSPVTVDTPRVTLAEYLSRERAASSKNILWKGEIFGVWAMAGGTPAHNTIAANVIVALGVALRGGRCRVMTSDQKIWVPRASGVVYPDVVVACGGLALLEGTTDVLTNPSLLVEVLSPSTENFDRGEKFAGYRAIPSLRHYLLVSASGGLVERYARGDAGDWTYREHGAGQEFALSGLEISLRVDDLYTAAFDPA